MLCIQGLIALSLCGNKIDNVEVVVQEVTKFKNLRALWLNNNPVVQNRYVCMFTNVRKVFTFLL